MEYKIVWIAILTAYGSWHVYAAVDCSLTGSGRFIDPDDSTCRKFSLCLYFPINCQYKAFDYTCPPYTIFDPALSACTPTTNFVCKSKPPICTDQGSFPNPDSADCTSFVTCTSDGQGSFTHIVEDCDAGNVFDPTTSTCVDSYTCPKKFSCSAKGYVANTDDKACQSYYYCSSLANDKYVSYDYKCSGIWKFHPILKVCTPFYDCK